MMEPHFTPIFGNNVFPFHAPFAGALCRVPDVRAEYLRESTLDLLAVAGSATPRSRVLMLLAADESAGRAAAGGAA